MRFFRIMPFFPPTIHTPLRTGLMLLALGLAAPIASHAQNQQNTPKKELSDKVSEELAKIRTQTDAKNYDGALAIIDGLLKISGPESYDMALLSQVKAQILLTKGEYAKSIPPLETAVTLSDKYSFFDDRQSQELTYYLSQLYYQEAVTSKVVADQKKYYEKAVTYMDRWASRNTKPNPDVQLYYATLLFYQSQLDQNNPDRKLLKRAQEEVEKGLRMSARPKDTFYLLLFATLQQQEKIKESIDVLELYLKLKPDAKTYWPQLASLYLNQQNDIRVIVTIERAQKLGSMVSPKDNFTLVGLYFNIGQFDYVIDLLSKGLKDGTIENEQRNWELLAAAYMQQHKELKAIEVLKEASKLYPDAGSLLAQIAQTYYQLEKIEDAYTFAKAAVARKLEKPWTTELFLAYVSYELKKYDEALVAVNKAAAYPQGAKDAERLKKGIEDAIAEAAALREQIAAESGKKAQKQSATKSPAAQPSKK